MRNKFIYFINKVSKNLAIIDKMIEEILTDMIEETIGMIVQIDIKVMIIDKMIKQKILIENIMIIIIEILIIKILTIIEIMTIIEILIIGTMGYLLIFFINFFINFFIDIF